jgi:hypothetical protein
MGGAAHRGQRTRGEDREGRTAAAAAGRGGDGASQPRVSDRGSSNRHDNGREGRHQQRVGEGAICNEEVVTRADRGSEGERWGGTCGAQHPVAHTSPANGEGPGEEGGNGRPGEGHYRDGRLRGGLDSGDVGEENVAGQRGLGERWHHESPREGVDHDGRGRGRTRSGTAGGGRVGGQVDCDIVRVGMGGSGGRVREGGQGDQERHYTTREGITWCTKHA